MKLPKSSVKKVIKKPNIEKTQTQSTKAKSETKQSEKTKKSTSNVGKSVAKGAVLGGVATAAGIGAYQIASGVIGSISKGSVASTNADDPKTLTASHQTPTEPLQYPLGKDADITCWMHITAFKYIYDKNDIPGNRRILDSELSTQVKRLYTVKLPLPGDISTSFSAKWSDYTSVWSKIIRASNVAEGEMFDVEQFKDRIANLVGSGALEDAKKVGMMSAFSGIITGSGIGSSLGTGIGDALTYLKVAGGIAINPMSQASYQGHDINEHSFQFNLVPRNARESNECQKIIAAFEDSIHAEKSNELGGILMNYPDMFNIRFTGPKGEIIPGILEIPDCHLTSINVNRSNGTNGFKITKDYNPVNYVLSLNFREAQSLVRNDLKFLRQSTEQASALHSGKPIPNSWDPNQLLKDIRPFDVALESAPVAQAASESATQQPATAESEAAAHENASGSSLTDNINNVITKAHQQQIEAYLKGKEHLYKTQGLSDWADRARKDFIKMTRNSSDPDHIKIKAAIRNAIINNNQKVKVGTTINNNIDKRVSAAADFIERQLVADSKSKVNVVVPGVGVSINVEKGTYENAKGIFENMMMLNPLGFALEVQSQIGRKIVSWSDLTPAEQQKINSWLNIFNTKSWWK